MNTKISELEVLLMIQENYFDHLEEQGKISKKNSEKDTEAEFITKSAEKEKKEMYDSIYGLCY